MSKRARTERATLCVADLPSSSGKPTPERSPALASPALCRYKTGRCMNPRVVKPNGTLLLLCEYHRCQQNRTKKRSDMKYRQHRAAKRQLERAAQHPPASSAIRNLATASDDTIDCPTASPPRQNPRHASIAKRGPKRKSGSSDAPPLTDTHFVYDRATNFAASPPPAVICSRAVLKTEFRGSSLSAAETVTTETMTSASPTTTAEFESAASLWPSAWADVLLPPPSPASPPPQLSPLAPSPASPVAWQPEELELLEYFIMP